MLSKIKNLLAELEEEVLETVSTAEERTAKFRNEATSLRNQLRSSKEKLTLLQAHGFTEMEHDLVVRLEAVEHERDQYKHMVEQLLQLNTVDNPKEVA